MSPAPQRGGAAVAWLELLRLPNLFTVPGDVLAGWCLAGGWGQGLGPLACAVAASLCLYAVGLLLNDAFDVSVDARERPGRPIPSGRVRLRTVIGVAVALACLGLALAWREWPCALVLLGAIVLYDGFAKRVPGFGVLTMGACRGLNVLLGACCASPPAAVLSTPLLLAAVAFFVVYTLLLSVVAKNEAAPADHPSLCLRWSPALLTLCLVPTFWLLGAGPLWTPVVAAALMAPFLLGRRDVPALVAALIRHLIPLQLVWCLAALPDWGLALPAALLGLWALSLLAARRFKGS